MLKTEDVGHTIATDFGMPPPEPAVSGGYATRPRLLLIVLLTMFCLLTAVVPVYRAFHQIQVNYNEGWNVYLAVTASHHLPLYPAKYSWTPVVYPALSFYMMAELSKITREYIYTARAVSLVSLLICCILVGAITKKVTGAALPAFLSACFCLALFCAAGTDYVGMDDPQMLAQVFFLAGMLLYLSRKPDTLCLAGAAFFFVLAGSIKHTPVYFPLAVFLDLCLVSGRRALQFLLYGLAFLAAAIFLNIHVGGPFFIANMMMPRVFSFSTGLSYLVTVYGRLQLPLLGAAFAATFFWKNAAIRPISIWFVLSLLLGIVFSGGSGVNVNAFFGNFLSIAVLVGVLISFAWEVSAGIQKSAWLELGLPVVLFAALLSPFQISHGLRPLQQFRKIQADQARFENQVRVIHDQPGPAICHSLLRCYLAGKPYLINPFDSSSLVLFGKLDAGEIVGKIQKGEYGAIQIDRPLIAGRSPQVVLDAIDKYYVPILKDPDCIIFVPDKTRIGPTQTVGLYHQARP